MEKIVITGGAGFIGSELGYVLSKQGYNVVLVDDMSFGYEDNLKVDNKEFAEFKHCDIRDKKIFSIVKDAKCVFHFAGISSLPVCQENPYYATDVNVAGTANVLEACRINGIKVIFASTSAIYENNTNFPFVEDNEEYPSLMYSASKLQAEKICKTFIDCYNMEIIIIRFANVYGPKQDFKRKSPPLASYIIRELLNNNAPILHSDGKQKRDYVYVDDLIDLLMLCMNKKEAVNNIFNACSQTVTSVNKIYKIITKLLNSPIKAKFRSSEYFWDKYPNLYQGKLAIKMEILQEEVNKYTICSNKKAFSLLGWQPSISIEQGLEMMIEKCKKSYFS